MGNKIILVEEQIKEEVSAMSIGEVYGMAQLAKELENSTGVQIAQILLTVTNLKNNEHGKSNKVVCAENNVNHHAVIAVLQTRGWLDFENQLTSLGFREMNDAVGVVNFSMGDDTLVLQNYNGSLYWNTDNTLFEDIWAGVLADVEGQGYNVSLKASPQPLSRQTLKLFEELGIVLED